MLGEAAALCAHGGAGGSVAASRAVPPALQQPGSGGRWGRGSAPPSVAASLRISRKVLPSPGSCCSAALSQPSSFPQPGWRGWGQSVSDGQGSWGHADLGTQGRATGRSCVSGAPPGNGLVRWAGFVRPDCTFPLLSKGLWGRWCGSHSGGELGSASSSTLVAGSRAQGVPGGLSPQALPHTSPSSLHGASPAQAEPRGT